MGLPFSFAIYSLRFARPGRQGRVAWPGRDFSHCCDGPWSGRWIGRVQPGPWDLRRVDLWPYPYLRAENNRGKYIRREAGQ